MAAWREGAWRPGAWRYGAWRGMVEDVPPGEPPEGENQSSCVWKSRNSRYTTVAVDADSTVVFNGPAKLLGVYVNVAMSAATLLLKDGADTVIVLPASLAAGTSKDFPGVVFETSLVISSAGTGEVAVFWEPL